LGIQVELPAEADSAQGPNAAVAVGVGLGVGLVVIILVVSGAIFWFFFRRRAGSDVAEESEVATDAPESDELPDGWGERVQLASGENALASEGPIDGVPFVNAEMMDEALRTGVVVP
jgi:hypothetical protein